MQIKNYYEGIISRKDRKKFNRALYEIEYSMHIICEISDFDDSSMMHIKCIKNFRNNFRFLEERFGSESINRLIEEREEFALAHQIFNQLID